MSGTNLSQMERYYLSIGLDNADRLLYEVEQDLLRLKDKMDEVSSYVRHGRDALDRLISARLEAEDDEDPLFGDEMDPNR